MENLELINSAYNINVNENEMIDLFQQHLSKKEIIKILKKEKEFLPQIIGGSIPIVTSIGSYSLLTTEESFILFALGAWFLIEARNNFKTHSNKAINESIKDIIANSDSYLECKTLYNNYLKNLAEFLKSINIKNSLDICIAYEILDRWGYLTGGNEHIYKEYKYDLDGYCSELHGTRVITGTSVCRHKSAMLTDLLNKMNISACNLGVRGYSDDLYDKMPLLIKKLNFKPNHMVTGIVDKDGKYLFDPTWQGNIATFNTEKTKQDKILTEEFAVSLFREFCYKIKLDDERITECNKNNLDVLNLFEKSDAKTLSKEEVIELKNYLLSHLYAKDETELNDFYREQQPVMKKIKTLSEQIMPFSDSKIKTWKIK